MVLALLLFAALTATPAKTTPLGFPQFADPPERNGAGINMKPSGMIRNTGKGCHQVVSSGAWRCIATEDTVEAARQSAVTEARAGAAADSAAAVAKVQGDLSAQMVTLGNRVSVLESTSATKDGLASAVSTLNTRIDNVQAGAATPAALASAAAALNGRIDSVQATAGAAATQSALAAAVKPLQDADTAMAARLTSLEQTSATQSTVAALTSRVTTLEGNYVSNTALAAALSPLAARIAALEAAGRVCTSTTLTGISIPIAGLSTVTTVTLAGAPAGTTCSIATNTRMPLGATPEGIVSQAGVVSVAFRGNTNLLSGAIAIPSGTYRVCCDR